MKKVYAYIILVGFLSICPILVIFASYYFKLDKISYDFSRTIYFKINEIRKFDLKYNSYYIAGGSGEAIYLGNYTTKPRLLKINSLLTDTQSVKIHLSNKDLHTKSIYKIFIDSPNFYLFNGYERSILKGNVRDWKAQVLSIYSPYFQDCIPLNPQSFIFKYVSLKSNNNSFRKESITSKRIDNDKILEKQVDGLFCTSGILEYNQELKYFTYLYHYRNQILLIDSNLKLIGKIKTIDPIDTAKFTVSTIKSNQSSVITSPSLLVNAKGSTWKNYLFVQSKLMGKHEDEIRFKRSIVLDIYDLKKRAYLYSVYLPKQDEKEITQIKVVGNFIYTMSDHYIYRYDVGKLPAS